ncbi:MAG: hypothetical protein O7D91_07295 [Planctomycetota bacterium]|nr:hypothetical protein [Planctomycetota bacterium]
MRVLKYPNSKFRGLCAAPVLCAALVCSVLSIAPGCATLGPTSLPADRFNYNKSLARSANEQLLLNIVRLRYGEPLHWLEVSSMLSQYSLEASVNANSWWNDLDTWGPALRAVYGVDGDASKQSGVDGGVSYSDRPTISYTPVQGEDFARRLLSPVPVSIVLFFAQAGWPIDEVLQLCVDRINGLANPLSASPFMAAIEGDAAAKFERMLDLLRATQNVGRLQGAIETAPDSDEPVLVLDPTDEDAGGAEELRRILGIDATVTRIRVTPRGHANARDELAIQTRSLLGIMQVLARFVEPPEAHARRQMILKWPDLGTTRDCLRVRHSSTPKSSVFVQIRHKGHWFYIDDADVNSKRTFALITYLYSLQASDLTGRGPLLTVPAGR